MTTHSDRDGSEVPAGPPLHEPTDRDADRHTAELRAEVQRLLDLLGSHADEHLCTCTLAQEHAKKAEAEVAGMRIELGRREAEERRWKQTCQELSDEMDSSRKRLSDELDLVRRRLANAEYVIDTNWRPGVAMRELKIARLTDQVTDLNYAIDREAQARQAAELAEKPCPCVCCLAAGACTGAPDDPTDYLKRQVVRWRNTARGRFKELRKAQKRVREVDATIARVKAVRDRWARIGATLPHDELNAALRGPDPTEEADRG